MDILLIIFFFAGMFCICISIKFTRNVQKWGNVKYNCVKCYKNHFNLPSKYNNI